MRRFKYSVCTGETLFASTSRAFKRMPDAMKRRLEGLTVRHHFDYGALHYGDDKRKEIESLTVSAVHPVVERHPESGLPVLMVNAQTVDRIVELPKDESAALVAEIVRHISAPDNVYRHSWRSGDLVVWDNRLLQHARSDFDKSERRTLRRCAIAHDLEPAPLPQDERRSGPPAGP